MGRSGCSGVGQGGYEGAEEPLSSATYLLHHALALHLNTDILCGGSRGHQCRKLLFRRLTIRFDDMKKILLPPFSYDKYIFKIKKFNFDRCI